MNSETIILIFIGICIGILLIGIGLCIRRFPYLLAGFDKLTEEEKKSQKIRDSIALTGKLLVRAGFCTCIGSVFSLIIKSDFLFLFFLFAPVLIACLFITVNNAIHIPYKKKSNIGSLFIVVVISVSIPFFFIYCSQEPTIEIDNDNIRIKCIYEETININEIDEIVLSEQIPPIKLRTNGYSFNGIKVGYFLTQKGDIIKLFIFNSQKPYICIKLRTGRVVFLNFKEYGKTIEVYNRIRSLEEEKRNEYLIQIGREVTKQFGPGYYREYKQPIISAVEKFDSDDERPEIAKNIGREYYTVTFLYDKSKESLDFGFASKVRIWKDTGEPLGVIFGNGYGKNFFFISYKQFQMNGIDSTDQIPYQQTVLPDTIWTAPR